MSLAVLSMDNKCHFNTELCHRIMVIADNEKELENLNMLKGLTGIVDDGDRICFEVPTDYFDEVVTNDKAIQLYASNEDTYAGQDPIRAKIICAFLMGFVHEGRTYEEAKKPYERVAEYDMSYHKTSREHFHIRDEAQKSKAFDFGKRFRLMLGSSRLKTDSTAFLNGTMMLLGIKEIV